MFVLAVRNLFRNVRRTIITLLAIAFGLSMVHVTIALQTGSYADMIEAGVSALAGHVVVQARGYQEEKDGDLVLSGARDVTDRLTAAFPGATVTPRLLLAGLLLSPRSSVGAAVSGIDGAAEAVVQDLDDKLIEGTWLDGDGRGILIGAKLAESLQLKLGEKVVYMGQHGGATEVQSRLFRVKGIFRTGAPELDGFVAFVDLPAAQEAFGAPDVVHQVAVHLPDPNATPAATASTRALLGARPELEVLDWAHALPDLLAIIDVDKKSNNFIMFVLGAIVTMGALNTVLMSVMERTREFGVMLSLGLRPGQLARLILTEGLLLGVLGGALGLVLGTALAYPLVAWGLDYRDYVGESYETAGVVVSGIIKGRYHPLRSVLYTGIGVAMTTLSAVYPAWFVTRLQPVEAMRHT